MALDAALSARLPDIAAAGLEALGPTYRARGSGEDYSLEVTIDFRRSGSIVENTEKVASPKKWPRNGRTSMGGMRRTCRIHLRLAVAT